jgi:hypothetical protein
VPKPYRHQKNVTNPLKAFRIKLGEDLQEADKESLVEIREFYEMELLPPLVTIEVGDKKYDTFVVPAAGSCKLRSNFGPCQVETGQSKGLKDQPPRGISCFNTNKIN